MVMPIMRYACLCPVLQVSQYTFAMCSYREKKPDPTEIMQLDGFTVDYCEPVPGQPYVLMKYSLEECSFLAI